MEFCKGCSEMVKFGFILLPTTPMENQRCLDEDLKLYLMFPDREFDLVVFFTISYSGNRTSLNTHIIPCTQDFLLNGLLENSIIYLLDDGKSGSQWDILASPSKICSLMLSWSISFLFFLFSHLVSSECKLTEGGLSSVHSKFPLHEYSGLGEGLQVSEPQ